MKICEMLISCIMSCKYYTIIRLMDEVGMAVPKSAQSLTRFMGIITSTIHVHPY